MTRYWSKVGTDSSGLEIQLKSRQNYVSLIICSNTKIIKASLVVVLKIVCLGPYFRLLRVYKLRSGQTDYECSYMT